MSGRLKRNDRKAADSSVTQALLWRHVWRGRGSDQRVFAPALAAPHSGTDVTEHHAQAGTRRLGASRPA